MASINERPLISFSHGRHCDGTIFNEVRQILSQDGWQSIAPTYDITKGDKDLDQHADQLAHEEAATGAEEVWRFGWSWGANVIIRDRGGPRIARMSFIAGAFHPASVAWADGAVPNTSHNLLYDAFEKVVSEEIRTSRQLSEEELKIAFYELAKNCIFTDITEDSVVMDWARKMRPHPRRQSEPEVTDIPVTPMDYVVLTRDKAVLNQETKHDEDDKIRPGIADGLATKVDVAISHHESDHAPMVSDAGRFAGLIARLAVELQGQPVKTS